MNATGTLEMSGAGNVFSTYFGGSALTNSGTLRKSVSAGDATLGYAAYSNTGRIDVQAGRLLFIAPLGLAHGGVVSGAGRVVIAADTTTLTGTTTISSSMFELGGGTLYAAPAAAGTLAGSSIEWSSGYVAGLVKWNGIARTTGSGFRRINGASELLNAGVLTLAGAGTIQFYENSILRNLLGGTLQATGQVSVSNYFGGNILINEGSMVLGASPGRMTVNAAFTQTASGRLEVGVAGPSDTEPQFDILNVNGPATLDGTLVARVEGGYNPPACTQFQVLTGIPRVGTFASLVGSRFNATYPVAGIPPVSANNVVLVAQSTTAEDFATWAANRGLTGNDAASTADPDGDSLLNWHEYAFNLNPKVGNGSPLAGNLEMIGGENWLVMRYRRWSGPLDAGLVYQPEWSGGLASWSAAEIIDEFDADATPVTGSEPRRCRILANEARKFLRLDLGSP